MTVSKLVEVFVLGFVSVVHDRMNSELDGDVSEWGWFSIVTEVKSSLSGRNRVMASSFVSGEVQGFAWFLLSLRVRDL